MFDRGLRSSSRACWPCSRLKPGAASGSATAIGLVLHLTQFGKRGGQVEGIAHLVLEREQLGEQTAHAGEAGGVGREIRHFEWVALEIEEQGAWDLGVEDQLVVFESDGALEIKIGAVDGVVSGAIGLSAQEWEQAVEIEPGRGSPGEFERGGHDVLKVNRGVDGLAFGDVRPDGDERHADAVVVEVLFAHQAVVPDGEAMVGSKEDVGVPLEGRGIEGVEDATQLGVHVGDDGVVFLAMDFDGEFGAGEGGEAFVAQVGAAADVGGVRVSRKESGGQRDAVERDIGRRIAAGDCRGSWGALKAIYMKNGLVLCRASSRNSRASSPTTSLQCLPPSQ